MGQIMWLAVQTAQDYIILLILTYPQIYVKLLEKIFYDLTHATCRHTHLYSFRSDAEGTIMEEIPAGGCTYVYSVGDFSFERLPEDEQLLVVPFVMRTLRMAGLGECPFGPLHLENEEAAGIRLRYSGYREGAASNSCLSYTPV